MTGFALFQVREYMFQLEAHLAEAHRQAQRLIKQQGLLGASLSEFGTSMISLGKFEQGRLADNFINLGEKAESLARTSQVRFLAGLYLDLREVACVYASCCMLLEQKCEISGLFSLNAACIMFGQFSTRTKAPRAFDVQDQAGQLGVSFEAPLREYVRMVKSAKAVMADRSLALGALQQSRADVDAKRTKLAKLRGTPGIKVHTSLCSLVDIL